MKSLTRDANAYQVRRIYALASEMVSGQKYEREMGQAARTVRAQSVAEDRRLKRTPLHHNPPRPCKAQSVVLHSWAVHARTVTCLRCVPLCCLLVRAVSACDALLRRAPRLSAECFVQCGVQVAGNTEERGDMNTHLIDNSRVSLSPQRCWASAIISDNVSCGSTIVSAHRPALALQDSPLVRLPLPRRGLSDF